MRKTLLQKKKHFRERGASIFEAMAALCFLCLFFFALLQIYQWCTAKLFCRYSSYYGAKGRALGYKTNLVLRAARVAAIPISGASLGVRSHSELQDANQYMTRGDASGVRYHYWHPQRSSDVELRLNGYHDGNNIKATVSLFNMPLISPRLGKLLGIGANPVPKGTSGFYNHSAVYLED